VHRLESTVESLRSRCADKTEIELENSIKKLPQNQQEAIRTCFQCSQKKGPTGNRFITLYILLEWDFESEVTSLVVLQILKKCKKNVLSYIKINKIYK
jgi:hypothetical protein